MLFPPGRLILSTLLHVFQQSLKIQGPFEKPGTHVAQPVDAFRWKAEGRGEVLEVVALRYVLQGVEADHDGIEIDDNGRSPGEFRPGLLGLEGLFTVPSRLSILFPLGEIQLQ